jgi:hypothetical protein
MVHVSDGLYPLFTVRKEIGEILIALVSPDLYFHYGIQLIAFRVVKHGNTLW